ncbi:MAG: YezD family protein [bacterium]
MDADRREKNRHSAHFPPAAGEANDREIVEAILAAVKSIRCGSVEIVIQDPKVVQIERKEKSRFNKEGAWKAR